MIYELRYYSGAGNTELLSKILEHQLIARGHHGLRSRLKNHSFNVHSEDFRTLGLGFPVHFRQAPRLVYEFLRTLDGRGKGIFIFSTKGLYSGNAVEKRVSICGIAGVHASGFSGSHDARNRRPDSVCPQGFPHGTVPQSHEESAYFRENGAVRFLS